MLQAGFVLFSLLPSHQNLSKRIVKSPKLYFYDVGICRYLMGLREATQLPMNQSFGPLFETMVVADIRKQIENFSVPADLSFFRSSDGIEVDVLLTLGQRVHALEIKATATPSLEQLSSLRKWLKLSGTRKATVLCLVDEERPLGEGIRALPWWDHPRVWN